MSEIERQWSADAFDAISIVAVEGQFEIEGTDGNQVELEGEFHSRFTGQVNLEPVGRWLQLHNWERPAHAQITLRLPKNKAWILDISAATGQVEVTDIQARLRVMLGKGEIEIENCRGVFNLASGKGDIQLERCIEAEMPARPPQPEAQPQFQIPPMPKGPAADAEFHFGFGPGPHLGPKIKHRTRWDWSGWEGEEWMQWGQQLGEQAHAWAQQFVGQALHQVNRIEEKTGINLNVAKGHVEIKDVDATTLRLRMASGEVEIGRGRVQNLELNLFHGEFEIESVMPQGDWDIQVKRGDIHLSLPRDAEARLDVATRQGDIESQVPLVRVGRPGPEARHGGRMVGTIGRAEGQVAQVNLGTLHGDIEIELGAESKYGAQQATTPGKPVGESTPLAAAQADTNAGGAWNQTPVAGAERPAYDSQMEVLQALSEGHISVAEAEELLRSVKP